MIDAKTEQVNTETMIAVSAQVILPKEWDHKMITLGPDKNLLSWIQSCPNPSAFRGYLEELRWIHNKIVCKECGESFRRCDTRRYVSSAYDVADQLVCKDCFNMWTDGTLVPVSKEKWDDQPLPVRNMYEDQDTSSGHVHSLLDFSRIGTFSRYNKNTQCALIALTHYPVRLDECRMDLFGPERPEFGPTSGYHLTNDVESDIDNEEDEDEKSDIHNDNESSLGKDNNQN
jgi:hypothetical protein